MRPLILVVGLALVASADAGPRAGKVVRVDRARRLGGAPRWCGIGLTDLTAYCYGKRPEPGERVTIVDSRHVIGTLRIESSEPGTSGPSCPQSQAVLWTAKGALESGDLSVPPDSQAVGFIDVPIDARTGKLVRPDHPPGDRPIEQMFGVDGNGDGEADVVAAIYTCDDHGNPPSVNSPATSQCVELWYAAGKNFERLRVDRISQNCF